MEYKVIEKKFITGKGEVTNVKYYIKFKKYFTIWLLKLFYPNGKWFTHTEQVGDTTGTWDDIVYFETMQKAETFCKNFLCKNIETDTHHYKTVVETICE